MIHEKKVKDLGPGDYILVTHSSGEPSIGEVQEIQKGGVPNEISNLAQFGRQHYVIHIITSIIHVITSKHGEGCCKLTNIPDYIKIKTADDPADFLMSGDDEIRKCAIRSIKDWR